MRPLSIIAAAALMALGLALPHPAAAQLRACGEGPAMEGTTVVGTPCDDTIRVPAAATRVQAGPGDDTIVPMPIAASADCPQSCFLGVGSQTFEGGPGDDVVFGQRGNDRLYGGEGNDRLYGGIGDDTLRGGPGDDRLYGGFGFDYIDGEAGNDFVEGGATVDEILDSSGGQDVLSYATATAPGFTRDPGVPGFPPPGGERGVYLDLRAGVADNGVSPNGGGVDDLISEPGAFETIVGSPFSDYIVGSEADETIYGGGGADAIYGMGGNDTLHGGADGDLLEGGEGTNTIDPGTGPSANAIATREPGAVSAGFEAGAAPGTSQLYLIGSSGADQITATYSAGPPVTVSFDLVSAATFDETPPGCEAPAPAELVCQPPAPLDALVLDGAGGDDGLRADGFPAEVATVILGGPGDDSLRGGEASEDVLVGGPGEDLVEGLGGDDALTDTGGADVLAGGPGNDLFVSNGICEGDRIEGGDGRDNASWAQFHGSVETRLESGLAGEPGAAGPTCVTGTLGSLQGIEDLEGSGQDDFLYGDSGPNQLLGRHGHDTYHGMGGDDSLLANFGEADVVIDCGEGSDSALIDLPPISDPTPIECELVNGAPPESIEPPTPEEAAPLPVVRPPRRDRTPPRTRIVHRPPRVATSRSRVRRVAFAFRASEPGSSFRCRIDRRRFRRCRSPRSYRLRLGRHVFAVFAVDAAGNRDRTPARFSFRLRRARR